MKKLSLLIALAMLISIGGVYATWNYAQGSVPATSGDAQIALEMQATSNAKGSITVTPSADLKILIDDTNNDYYGEIVVQGSITVTFNAASGADSDVATNGIPMQYVLSYNGSHLAVTGTAQQKDKCNTFTITADDLKALISLDKNNDGTSDVYLPTLEDYNEFKQNDLGKITITVSEVTTTG